MSRVTNTTERAKNEPILGLMDAMNIEASERQGQRELERSSQLPFKIGGGYKEPVYEEIVKEYEKHGIKVLQKSKGDDLFVDVVLPEGWKIKGTGHAMWNNVIDQNGRIRATFFYKAAFYDRDAFLNFDTRYSFHAMTYLPSDEKGHYEIQKVKKRFQPQGAVYDEEGNGFIREDAWGMIRMFKNSELFKEVEEKVWVPKFKDPYEERNNTPMYFEILDGQEVIFSTKDKPVFFKRKYDEAKHRQWWNDFDALQRKLSDDAIQYLNEKFPEWKDTTKYF